MQKLPKDGQSHVLRFEAEGHETEERSVNFAQSQDVVVVLKALPAAPVKPDDKQKPRTGVGKPKPVRKANCDPPFIVDARGVKRYKPECL